METPGFHLIFHSSHLQPSTNPWLTLLHLLPRNMPHNNLSHNCLFKSKPHSSCLLHLLLWMTFLSTAHLVALQASLSILQTMGQIHPPLAAQLLVIMPAIPLMITLTLLAMMPPTPLAMATLTLLAMIILIILALTCSHTLSYPPMYQLRLAQQSLQTQTSYIFQGPNPQNRHNNLVS